MSVEAYALQNQIYRRSTGTGGDVGDLWRAYRNGPCDESVRQGLILRYAPLVKYVAGRLAMFLPTALSNEDLLGHGTIGLIEAVDRYDPSLGVKFETFAVRRIWGAMIDALRALSALPRSTTRQIRALDAAFADLEREFGRTPTNAEVGQRLGLDEVAVGNLLVAANFSVVSLDTTVGGGEDEGQTFLDLLVSEGDDPSGGIEREEQLATLTREIERLPERERLVLALYYHEELTLKEIGRVLQVSESRVSQLHSAAVRRLRAALAPRPVAVG